MYSLPERDNTCGLDYADIHVVAREKCERIMITEITIDTKLRNIKKSDFYLCSEKIISYKKIQF